MSRRVSSWGRLLSPLHDVSVLHQSHTVPVQPGTVGLPYGNGRSYGDVCLNPGGMLWMTWALDRFISFDPERGLLTCQAGVLLRDIQRLVVPRGWMLPVTPGTQLITVGGAIANDVHGKNHHVMGTFGDHVMSLRLLRTDGEAIVCGPEVERGWFDATVGGMGLTGTVTEATLKLRRVQSAWLTAETLPFANLAEFFELSNGSEPGWEHTVAWVDCLNGQGRGVFMRANHAEAGSVAAPKSLRLSVPFVPPISLINDASLRLFNWAYYLSQTHKKGPAIVHYEPFFYPLDNVNHWNRMYGPNGFYQYQCVVPGGSGKDAILTLLKLIAQAGQGSFLAVLKMFGERKSRGMMSFPMPGVTLALDFPNKGENTRALLGRLDQVVREAGGRIYAAKDSCMSADLFRSGYPRFSEFVNYRDPGISSAMSRRVMGY